MSGSTEDCLACRLTSGGGLIGAGVYVIAQARKFQYIPRHVITAIGTGIGTVGFLRLFNLPPFRRKKEEKLKMEKIITSNDENYIVELFPARSR